MKFSMTGQEKCDLLIQVAAWAGLTVYLNKNWKIYWSEQCFTGLETEDQCSLWGLLLLLFLYFILCLSVKLDSLSCSSTSISFPTECILRGSRLNHINTCILRCIRVLYHCLLLYTWNVGYWSVPYCKSKYKNYTHLYITITIIKGNDVSINLIKNSMTLATHAPDTLYIFYYPLPLIMVTMIHLSNLFQLRKTVNHTFKTYDNWP